MARDNYVRVKRNGVQKQTPLLGDEKLDPVRYLGQCLEDYPPETGCQV
jgi:hypothetical protein